MTSEKRTLNDAIRNSEAAATFRRYHDAIDIAMHLEGVPDETAQRVLNRLTCGDPDGIPHDTVLTRADGSPWLPPPDLSSPEAAERIAQLGFTTGHLQDDPVVPPESASNGLTGPTEGKGTGEQHDAALNATVALFGKPDLDPLWHATRHGPPSTHAGPYDGCQACEARAQRHTDLFQGPAHERTYTHLKPGGDTQ